MPADETKTCEDCLYLNVWTPKAQEDGAQISQPKPVMVYIHGGAFRIGSASVDAYDGKALAARYGVVVVTLNYRLGALGFLYDGQQVQGNMGLLDQVEALRWVRDNIECFGGDPNRVTLFGESAGATAVGYHALSENPEVLFHRIIMQSGAPNWGQPLQTPEQGLQITQGIAQAVGCPVTQTSVDIGCLRRVQASAIAKAELDLFWNVTKSHLFTLVPRANDWVVPADPIDAVRRGLIKEVDIIIGTNRDEGLFVPFIFELAASGNNNYQFSRNQVQSYMKRVMGGMPDAYQSKILNDFSVRYPSNLVELMSDMFGGFMMVCPAQYFAEYISDSQPLYMYEFDYRATYSPMATWTGVTHTTMIPFTFGLPLALYFTGAFSDTDIAVSDYVMYMFTNFAKFGNPSTTGLLWPQFHSDAKSYMYIGRNGGMAARAGVPKQVTCDYYRNIIPS